MITVTCFLWFDPNGKNNSIYVYGPDHVRILKRMVERHLTLPHRFVCITDLPAHRLEGIETVPLDKTCHLPRTRYVKLMTFRPITTLTIGQIAPTVSRINTSKTIGTI